MPTVGLDKIDFHRGGEGKGKEEEEREEREIFLRLKNRERKILYNEW